VEDRCRVRRAVDVSSANGAKQQSSSGMDSAGLEDPIADLLGRAIAAVDAAALLSCGSAMDSRAGSRLYRCYDVHRRSRER